MTTREELLEQMRALADSARALDDPELMHDLRAMLAEPPPEARPQDEDPDVPIWHGIVGDCAPMVALRGPIEKFAAVRVPVLIRGESGTGKDLVARALHDLSPRRRAPLVSESCAAIPAGLLESVLFGHVKGAFTGAVRDHAGHFVAAHKGTLFLDEIGDTPPAMQVKLLRVLEAGEVRPVGGTAVRKVDVRVLAATNQDLDELVAAGRFREDLLYRLNVLQITLPPLRERGADIELLAQWFLSRAARAAGRELRLSAGALEVLRAGQWPGNVRQLQNEIHRAAALADGPEITPDGLAPDLRSSV